uniref:YD repeat-containing protein n=1 Tax=Steinernema glaseri TaxID=37863 RepID=A0A1I8ANR8_9BILA
MTYCTYDAVGRISGQHCGPLALQLGYDAFGRLAQTLTTDGQHGQSQQQTLTYDLLGPLSPALELDPAGSGGDTHVGIAGGGAGYLVERRALPLR